MAHDPQPQQTLPGDAIAEAVRPMGEALGKTVDKLTSQIFLFLIAYLILVIFLTISKSSMPFEVRVLLDILPVIGLIAYTYLKSKNISKEARNLQVAVKTRIATGEATVSGLRGTAPDALRKLDVSVGYAGGKAKVTGVDAAPADVSSEADSTYLLQLFRSLNAEDRREVIAAASRLLAKAK